LRDGINVDLYVTSNIEVYSDQWDNKKECIKAKVLVSPTLRSEIDTSVREYKNAVSAAYRKLVETKEIVSSQRLQLCVDKVLHPETYNSEIENEGCCKLSFFDLYYWFVRETKCGAIRKLNYTNVKHHLQSFEKYVQKTNRSFLLEIDTLSVEILNAFERFMFDDVNIFEKHPDYLVGFSQTLCKGTK
jgi:hypothetical protein